MFAGESWNFLFLCACIKAWLAFDVPEPRGRAIPRGPHSSYSETLHHPSSCCTAPLLPADGMNHARWVSEAGEQFRKLGSTKGNYCPRRDHTKTAV